MRLLSKIKKVTKHIDLLIPLFVSVLITIIWFRPGFMLAAAEDGLPFYDIERTIRLSIGVWHDIDLGLSTPLYLTRLPLLYVSLLLKLIGFSGIHIQIFWYLLVIFVGLYYSNKLFQIVDNSVELFTARVASLFYFFNLFVMSQVFYRFVYSLIFLWCLLPAFLYAFIKSLNKITVKNLLLLVLLSTLFSWTYLLVSPVLVLWGAAFVWFVFRVNRKNYKELILRFFIVLAVWVLFSLWWIIPFLRNTGSSQIASFSPDRSLLSLKQVSLYYSNIDVLLLKQKYYFDSNIVWNSYIQNKTLNIINFSVLLTVVIGIYSALVQKKNNIYFLLLLFLGWFFSKGANPPFGENFYQSLFKYLPFTQSIRNPYEKVGLIYVLGYSYMFALGVNSLWRIRNFGYKIIATFFLLLVFVMLALPMWKGSIYYNDKVGVPHEYKAVSEIIKRNWPENRIMTMPLALTGDVKLFWAPRLAAYNEFLLDNPSIPNPVIQDSGEFYKYFFKYLNKENVFSNVMKITSTCCVLLRKDVEQNKEYSSDYSGSLRILNGISDIYHVKDFNLLSLYAMDEKDVVGRVYVSIDLENLGSMDEMFLKLTNKDFDPMAATYCVDCSFAFQSKSNLPVYSYEKVGSTEYVIRMKDVENYFVLVLANNFSPNWKAYINNGEIDEHFVSNGFGNGWLIKKSGSYDIKISFNKI